MLQNNVQAEFLQPTPSLRKNYDLGEGTKKRDFVLTTFEVYPKKVILFIINMRLDILHMYVRKLISNQISIANKGVMKKIELII